MKILQCFSYHFLEKSFPAQILSLFNFHQGIPPFCLKKELREGWFNIQQICKTKIIYSLFWLTQEHTSE